MILSKNKQAKAVRDEQICKKYVEMRSKGAKKYTAIDFLSTEYGISANTIYRVTDKVRKEFEDVAIEG